MTEFTHLDRRWKMSQSDTHVYFVGGPFSQWWLESPFRGKLIVGSESFTQGILDFNCAEQYMMASKAALFDDEEAFVAIMATYDPKEQKLIGRKIKNFDPQVWDDNARRCVTQGNIYKFQQDPDLAAFLLSTNGKKLVEGAWYDPVWGVKLAWDDPKILDEANWQGTNWLGECLTSVRQTMFDDLMARIHPGHFS